MYYLLYCSTILQNFAGDIPLEVWNKYEENYDVTCAAYAGKDLLFTGTSCGMVCAWSVSEKRCFMHWQADNDEIGICL